MNDTQSIIAQINGTMAMEGMPLTPADEQRIERVLMDPSSFHRILEELKQTYSEYSKG